MSGRPACVTLAVIGLGLVVGLAPRGAVRPGAGLWARGPHAAGERVVFLAANLSDEQLITLTATLAAANCPGVLLLDEPDSRPYLKAFLADFQPERVIPVGSFPGQVEKVGRQLGVRLAPPLAWKRGPPSAVWQFLFPRAERVVVCPARPRALLLQAACLAGAVRAPLFVLEGAADEASTFRRWLIRWHTRTVFAAGAANTVCRDLPDASLTRLENEEAIAAATRQRLHQQAPIDTLILANPADGQGGMSSLAPWVAWQHRAPLLLTGKTGEAGEVIQRALDSPACRRVEHVLILADLKAIPMERRPNPVKGKDRDIEMEPGTPRGRQPFTLATGRLFHKSRSVITLMLARRRLFEAVRRPRALIVSNPGGSLPLLEAFSRNTVNELDNRGYATTALFEEEVRPDRVRRLLPRHNLFLWEGHYRTLVDDYRLPSWNEPLRPALVYLQSCLALNPELAQPLLQRGAVAVVGTSTRTYSGSGGAFTLAFFDALLYEGRTLGGALRQAKNFLQAYALLKEKRLGERARLGGANLRSAWAFTLWGDPTLKLPRPPVPHDALPPIKHTVHGNRIVVALPDRPYEEVAAGEYEAQMYPNGRLAGLLGKGEKGLFRPLVPLVFAEVHFAGAPAEHTPRLSSRLAGKRWVFTWDRRRRCGYLLVILRASDHRRLRFSVHWVRDEGRGDADLIFRKRGEQGKIERPRRRY